MTGSSTIQHTSGALIPQYTTLTDGTATVVFTGGKGSSIISSLQVSNKTGATVNDVIVDLYGGSSVLFEIEPGKPIASPGTAILDIIAWPISAGQTVRVTAAAGIGVMVIYYNPTYGSSSDQHASRV